VVNRQLQPGGSLLNIFNKTRFKIMLFLTRPVFRFVALCVMGTLAAGCAHDAATLASPPRSAGTSAPSGDGARVSDSAAAVQPVSSGVRFEVTTQTQDGQRYPDNVLRIVNKEDRNVDVALLVVGAMLGGFRLPVSKDDYRGTKVETLPHPAMDGLAKGIEKALLEWREKNGVRGTVYKHPVLIRKDRFALVFGEYMADKPYYDLQIQTTVLHKPDNAIWFLNPEYVTCVSNFQGMNLQLDQWTADDYALVRARGREHVRDCVQKTQAAFDVLFKD